MLQGCTPTFIGKSAAIHFSLCVRYHFLVIDFFMFWRNWRNKKRASGKSWNGLHAAVRAVEQQEVILDGDVRVRLVEACLQIGCRHQTLLLPLHRALLRQLRQALWIRFRNDQRSHTEPECLPLHSILHSGELISCNSLFNPAWHHGVQGNIHRVQLNLWVRTVQSCLWVEMQANDAAVPVSLSLDFQRAHWSHL